MRECNYCGREWAENQTKCWDGVDGCGAALGGIKEDITLRLPNNDFLRNHVTVKQITSRIQKFDLDDSRLMLVARKVNKLDWAILRGSGIEEPLGVLNSAALITVTRDLCNMITYYDLVTMLEHFSPIHGMWIVSKSAQGNLSSLQDPNGRYILAGDHLLGYPVFTSLHSPIMGRLGDILLADMRYYLLVEYGDLVDGQPLLRKPILSDCSTYQSSPFVALNSGVMK